MSLRASGVCALVAAAALAVGGAGAAWGSAPARGAHLYGFEGDLVLRENGSIAWIEGCLMSPSRTVWAADSHGRRMLDSGSGIDPTSLAISGSAVTWLRDGAGRSATID